MNTAEPGRALYETNDPGQVRAVQWSASMKLDNAYRDYLSMRSRPRQT
jgi:hypothetical protein